VFCIFTIEVWTRKGLIRFLVFFFIDLFTRKVEIAGIASRANGLWMSQVGRRATDAVDGILNGKCFLIDDRDPLFTTEFQNILTSVGVQCVKLPARSPNLNAHAERFVRSIKESCLGRLVLFGEASLRRAIREFVVRYHQDRNHQGLGNRLIASNLDLQATGAVSRRELLRGTLNYYYRAAAWSLWELNFRAIRRAIKRRISASLGFCSFAGAERTIQGYEAMHMIRKGQGWWLAKGDIAEQICFIKCVFGLANWSVHEYSGDHEIGSYTTICLRAIQIAAKPAAKRAKPTEAGSGTESALPLIKTRSPTGLLLFPEKFCVTKSSVFMPATKLVLIVNGEDRFVELLYDMPVLMPFRRTSVVALSLASCKTRDAVDGMSPARLKVVW
jgi:transposase InsO family protein